MQSDVGPGSDPRQAAADRLTQAAQAAYDQYSHDCSHAIWEVLKQMVNPSETYRTANELMTEMARPGSGWRQVASMQEASDLANSGKVVAGGLGEKVGHGHVVVVMPGPMRPSGGFEYQGKVMPSRGYFPPAMSTSSSGYPGTMSRVEKTVRDAWPAEEWPSVTFWTHE